MAVKIRLKRIGKKRAPHYRIVVMDARTKRDGRAIEEIGKYNPKAEPSFIHVESDRAQYWLGVGAQPTEAVEAIFKASGDWQKFKGEDAPAPLKVKEPKRDKQEIFNEALAEAHGTLKTEAVTAKKTAAKKADKKDDAPKDEAPKADEAAKADEAPKADEAAKADEAPKADEAAEAPAEAPADDAKA
ncbi:30S ribosomal protein S16 [Kribbella sp. NPDC050470]|uniref:30S ribosomal protein S16 n=1 Tax=unclassified Kribbella TaxID=2644121 RepID=UPI0037BDE975